MSFESDLQRHVRNAEKKAAVFIIKISFEAFKRIINKTPVKLGRARGNWQADINNYPSGQVNTLDSSGGTTENKMKSKVVSVKIGDIIYLVNNVPYILKLEDGGSKQAPQGMVKTTMAEIQNIVRDSAK